MGNSTTIELKAESKRLKSDLDRAEQLIAKFASGTRVVMATAAGAFAAVAGGYGLGQLIGTLHEFVGAGSKANDATAKLEAIITKTGGTAGYSAQQLERMADEVEKLTGINAESVQQAQALILTFENVRGDEFDRATKAAADLSKVLGTDVASAARVVGKALDDPVDALNQLARSGVDFSDQQKKVIQSLAETGNIVGAQKAILTALEAEVGGVAKAMGKTFSGQVAILGARFDDLGETIGKAVIPYIEALLPAAEIAIAGLQAVLDILLEFVASSDTFKTGFADVVVSTLKWVTTVFVDSFTFMLASYETFSMQVERATYGAMLVFVKTFEDLKHWFTVALPAYINWFADNWQNIFTDLAAFIGTVVNNMWTNLVNFFTNVFLYLSGQGGGLNWEWKGLTDGFQATMKKLPEIAEREMSFVEKQLSQNMAELGGRIEKVYQSRFEQGRALIDKVFGEPEKKEKEKPTESKKARRLVGKIDDPKDGSGKDAPKATGGQIVGVEELYNKLSAGGGGQSETVMGFNRIAAAQAMQVQQNQVQAAETKVNAGQLIGNVIAAIDKVNVTLTKLSVGLA